MKTRCWCGVTTDRHHYPANDPENGAAHLPSPLHPEEESTEDTGPETMREVVARWAQEQLSKNSKP